MAESLNPAAPHHLPSFITAPGETDVLLAIMAIILFLGVLGFGILFLRLHTLPERMAHKSHKIQFEIVAVLGLLALFTHIHAFWVAGLLLALVDVCDVASAMGRMVGSVEKIAGVKRPAEVYEMQSPEIAHGERAKQPHERAGRPVGPPSRRPESVHV